jgi:hypothetical protein
MDDTKSPAHLWVRDRLRERKALIEQRIAVLDELVASAHAAMNYTLEHANPEAVALSSRLAAALTAYYQLKPKTETHEANSGSQSPAQGD